MAEDNTNYLSKKPYKYTDNSNGNTFTSVAKLSPTDIHKQFTAMKEAGINMSDPQQNVKYGETSDVVLRSTARILAKEDPSRFKELADMSLDLSTENRQILEDEYFEKMRSYEWNTGEAVGLVGKLRGTYYDQEDKQALNIMFNNWEQTAPFYEGGLREWTAFAGDAGEAVLKDPATYIFMGAPALTASIFKNTVGKETTKAVLRQALKDSLASGATREAAEKAVKGKIKKQILKETGMSAAKWGAIEGSLIGGMQDVSLQEGKEELGIGEGATVESALKSMALGGTLGLVLGGGLGLVGGASKARKADLVDAKLQEVKGTVTLPQQAIEEAKKSKRTTQKQRDELYAAREEMDAKQAKSQNSAERRKAYDEFREVANSIAGEGKREFGTLPVGRATDAKIESEIMKFVQANSKKVKVKDITGKTIDTYETDVEKIIDNVTKIQVSDSDNFMTVATAVSKAAMKMQGKKFSEAKAALRRVDKNRNPEAYKAAEKLLVEESKLWEKSTAVFDLFKGESGRSLRIVGKDFKPLPELVGVENALDVYDTALGYINVSQDLGGASSYINTVKRLSNDVGKSKVGRAYEKTRAFLNDVFVHNLMNAISTPIVNLGSAFARFQISSIEDMLGGLVSGNMSVAAAGKLRMLKQLKYMDLALKNARHTFLTSDQTFSTRTVLDSMEGTDQQVSKDLNFSEGFMSGMQGATVGQAAMNLNRFISKRIMITGDDFNKTVSFTMKAYELIAKQLAESGDFKNVNAADFDKRVNELILESHEYVLKSKAQGNPLPEGSIEKQALDYAEEMAFQSDPQEDIFGMGASLANKMRTIAPVLTQIMPFVRTPANLLSYVGDRTPVMQSISKTMRDKLSSPDPRVRAKAEGAMALGSIIWASVFMMAASGKVTGRPPTDKAKRETRMADEDYLPYSIDGVSIRRFDPLARFAMTAGVIHDTLVYKSEEDQKNLYLQLAAGTAASLTEMPMLEGIQTVAGFFDFTSGRLPSNEQLMKSSQAHLSSYMPYVRLFEEIYGTQERARYLPQNIRMFDFYRGRPHLLNLGRPAYEEIDLKRDWNGDLALASNGANLSHLGISMKPKVDDDMKDVINDEFTRLQLGVSPMPKGNSSSNDVYGLFGLRLTEYKNSKGRSYHDILQERVGTVKIPDYKNMTLKEKLHDYITNDYEYLILPDKNYNNIKGKDEALKEIITEYRQLATAQIKEELENLDNETGEQFKNDLGSKKSNIGESPLDYFPKNIGDIE